MTSEKTLQTGREAGRNTLVAPAVPAPA